MQQLTFVNAVNLNMIFNKNYKKVQPNLVWLGMHFLLFHEIYPSLCRVAVLMFQYRISVCSTVNLYVYCTY